MCKVVIVVPTVASEQLNCICCLLTHKGDVAKLFIFIFLRVYCVNMHFLQFGGVCDCD